MTSYEQRAEAAERALDGYDCVGGMPWDEVVPIVLLGAGVPELIAERDAAAEAYVNASEERGMYEAAYQEAQRERDAAIAERRASVEKWSALCAAVERERDIAVEALTAVVRERGVLAEALRRIVDTREDEWSWSSVRGAARAALSQIDGSPSHSAGDVRTSDVPPNLPGNSSGEIES